MPHAHKTEAKPRPLAHKTDKTNTLAHKTEAKPIPLAHKTEAKPIPLAHKTGKTNTPSTHVHSLSFSWMVTSTSLRRV